MRRSQVARVIDVGRQIGARTVHFHCQPQHGFAVSHALGLLRERFTTDLELAKQLACHGRAVQLVEP